MPRAFDRGELPLDYNPLVSKLSWDLGAQDVGELLAGIVDAFLQGIIFDIKALTGIDLEQFGDFLADLLGSITGIHPGEALDIVSFIEGITQAFLNIPILGDLVEAITGVVGGGLVNLSEWAGNVPLIGDLVEAITGIIGGDLSALTDWAAGVPMLTDLVEALTGIIGGDLSALTNWAAGIPMLGDLVEAITGVIGGDLSALTDWAANLLTLEPIVEALTGIADGTLQTLTDWAASIPGLSELVEALTGIADGTIQTLTEWAAGINAVVGPVLQDIIDFFTNILDRSGFLALVENVANFFGDLLGGEFTIDSLITGLGAALTRLSLSIIPVTEIADMLRRLLIDPVISQLTGFATDLTALGTWAGNLLSRTDNIPAQNLVGEIATALFGVIPLSSVAETYPNLLNASAFGEGSVDAAEGWSWSETGYNDVSTGSLVCHADSTVQEIFSTQSIPVTAGDKMQLSAWVKTVGYVGSGSPIVLSLIPFQGVVQQTAITMVYTGSEPAWAEIESGTWTVTAGVTSVRVRIAVTNAMTAGDVYFDDIRLVKRGLLQQSWVERLTDAWNNFWFGVFGGILPTDKTVDDVYTAAAGITSTANTADSNATSALSQIATLAWNLLNLPGAVIGSIFNVIIDGVMSFGDWLSSLWNSFTGGSSTGKSASQVAAAAASVTATSNTAATTANSATTLANTAQAAANTANSGVTTANTNIQATVDAAYNAFNGTTTAVNKTRDEMRDKGILVRTSAVTGEQNASTALTNAATADGKAVTAQNTANTAQSTANTANTTANTAQSTASTAQTTADTAQTTVGQTVDGIVNGYRGWVGNWSTSDSTAVAGEISSAVAALNASVAALESQEAAGTYSGNSAVEDFSGYTVSSSLGGNWSQVYSGSGPTLGVNSISGVKRASWSSVYGDRTCKARYTVEQSATDLQKVGFVAAGVPQSQSGTYAYNTIYARMNSTGTAYVYAKLRSDLAEIGYNAGGGDVTLSTVSHTFLSGATYWLVAGTSAAATKTFQLLMNGNPILTVTGASSLMGAAYRYVGFGGISGTKGPLIQVLYLPAPVASFAFYDNTPPTYRGSGFRASKKDTGTMSLSATTATFPNSWYTTDYITDDFSYSTTGNTLTVGADGWYQVTIQQRSTRGTIAIAQGGHQGAALYRNGSVIARAAARLNNTGTGLADFGGTFTVYCEAGDTLQPGYHSTWAPANSMTGDTSGLDTYWTVSFIGNKMPSDS